MNRLKKLSIIFFSAILITSSFNFNIANRVYAQEEINLEDEGLNSEDEESNSEEKVNSKDGEINPEIEAENFKAIGITSEEGKELEVDENLEKYLKKAIKDQIGENEELTKENLEKIIYLDIRAEKEEKTYEDELINKDGENSKSQYEIYYLEDGENIESLKGIENCKNLVKLIIRGGSKKSIKISDLTPLGELAENQSNNDEENKLEYIDLSNNNIHENSSTENLKYLNKFSQLKYIDLAGNSIENIASFEKAKFKQDAIKISLGYQKGKKISNIDSLEGYESLEKLWLASNNIKDLSVLKKLKNLTELDIGANGFDTEQLENLSKLENLVYLGLNANGLKNIDVVNNINMPKLKYLKANRNRIFDISNLEGIDLIQLQLSSNKDKYRLDNYKYKEIKGLDAIKEMTSLRQLWLEEDNISNRQIESIFSEDSKIGSELKDLRLGKNNIDKRFNYKDEIEDAKIFDDYGNELEKLQLQTIAKGLKDKGIRIERLGLNENNIDNNENNIDELKEVDLSELISLNLITNKIEDISKIIEKLNSDNFTALGISDNRINNIISITKLEKLKELHAEKQLIVSESPFELFKESIKESDKQINSIEENSLEIGEIYSKENDEKIDLTNFGKSYYEYFIEHYRDDFLNKEINDFKTEFGDNIISDGINNDRTWKRKDNADIQENSRGIYEFLDKFIIKGDENNLDGSVKYNGDNLDGMLDGSVEYKLYGNQFNGIVVRIIENEKIKVIFDANGGKVEGSDKITKDYEKTDKIEEPETPIREGYKFKYWSVDKNGKIKYPFGRNATIDLMLYAQWEKIETPEPENPDGGGSGGGNHKPHRPNKPNEKPEEIIRPQINMLNNIDHFAYIKGYPEGDVRPEGNITREEVAVVFYRLLNDSYRDVIIKDKNNFKDIENIRWSNKEISTLENGKIVEGYEDNNFLPTKYITRAEVAAIASRFDNLENGNKNFNDIKGHWAEKYIISAAEKGWVKGYEDGSFKPDKEMTRAEFVTLVNGVLNRKVRSENILENIKYFTDLEKTAWYYEDIVESSNSHNYEKERLEDNSEKWIEIIKDRLY